MTRDKFLFTLMPKITITTVILIVWLPLTSTQTISIAGGTPVEGSTYQLDCIIAGIGVIGDHALVWSKDGRIIIWSQGTIATDVDGTGEFTSTEYTDMNGNYHFLLTFTQFRLRHAGNYKCFIANGTLMNFTELHSARREFNIKPSIIPTVIVTITPNGVITGAPGLYFPGSKWPVCYPQNNFRALINTEITIRCASSLGNPMVSVNLFSDGMVVSEASLIITEDLIERIYTFIVMPQDNGRLFDCQIAGHESYAGIHRSCNVGKIEVGLFQATIVHAQENASAIFNCTAGYQTAIHWSTDPPIQSSKLNTEDSAPNLLTITNVQMDDNGTLIICSVEGYNLQDQAQLIVIPGDDAATETTTEIGHTITKSGDASETKTTQKRQLISTHTSSASGSITSETPNPGFFIDAVIGTIAGGGVFLVMVLVICIVACVCCCKTRVTSDKADDNNPTRISTGYVWDRELSQRIHDSPMPSPRLSDRNHNHARARQALKNPDEGPSKTSSSLAYALANLSDDDLDSDTDDTLKKPSRKPDLTYQSIGDPSLANLNRASSVHSNLYASTSSPAPSSPAPRPPSQGSTPTYAVPDKVKQSIKKEPTPIYASTNRNPEATEDVSAENLLYAVVHPDPENPKVRTLSQNQGLVNSAYKPDEQDSEGFVANAIYEPGVQS